MIQKFHKPIILECEAKIMLIKKVREDAGVNNFSYYILSKKKKLFVLYNIFLSLISFQ